jgi:hypothetical protein
MQSSSVPAIIKITLIAKIIVPASMLEKNFEKNFTFSLKKFAE